MKNTSIPPTHNGRIIPERRHSNQNCAPAEEAKSVLRLGRKSSIQSSVTRNQLVLRPPPQRWRATQNHEQPNKSRIWPHRRKLKYFWENQTDQSGCHGRSPTTT